MAWSTVIGQTRVKQLLHSLWESQRLPHALLFFGPSGVGKDAAAIELARTLNCERGQWEACGQCQSCRAMETLRHPRVRLVFALPARADEKGPYDKFTESEMAEVHALLDAKGANPYTRMNYPKAQGIKISSIRDVRLEASYRSDSRGRSVVIIFDADRMNTSAANALLKTLEEPGGDLLLILTTSRRESLLPTILSRCQQIRFDALADEEIVRALVSEHDIDREKAIEAALLSQGSFFEALTLASGSTLIPRAEIREFLLTIHQYNPRAIMQKISSYASVDDKKALALYLGGIAGWFRDVLACQEGAADSIRNVDLRDPIEKFARHYPNVDCTAAILAVEDTIDLLQKNVHLVTALIVLANRLRRCLAPYLA